MNVLPTVLESLREELWHHPAYGETQIIVLAHTERVFSTIIEAKVLAKSPFENVAWDGLRVAVTPHRADVDERAPRASGRV